MREENMSEPMCVCGHGKNDHAQAVDGDGKELPEREWCRCCGCDLYNPILPWPDAEGWWWSEIKQRVVECTTNRAELCVMDCGQMWWQDEWQKINDAISKKHHRSAIVRIY